MENTRWRPALKELMATEATVSSARNATATHNRESIPPVINCLSPFTT